MSGAIPVSTGKDKANNAVPVTPDDGQDLSPMPTVGLYVGATGDLRVTLALMPDGEHVTFENIAGGEIHPLAVKRVWATGTSAEGLRAVY